MKRPLIVFMVGTVIVAVSMNVYGSGGFPALETPKTKPQAKPSVTPHKEPSAVKPALPQTQIDKQNAEKLRKARELVNQKRTLLDNTSWDIELVPMSGKGKPLEDVLVFSQGKIFTESLKEKGLGPTNFTLNIEEGGKLIAETMQSKENEVVFIRGEIAPDLEKMSGVFSFQRAGRGNEDYSFKSLARRRIYPVP